MKVALVHDWSVGYAGSERVLEQLLLLFPSAGLYMVADFIPPCERAFLGGRRPQTTFIQRLPLAKRWVRNYLPLMPLAVESLDLSAYDAVISSSHAVAKGVLTRPDQVHLCYCHTPLRYAWDLQHQYLRESGLTSGWRRCAALTLLHYMRMWDLRTANGVDRFLANSSHVAARIRRIYRRAAIVVHPPVDTEFFTPGGGRGDYYFTASRIVPYKRVELLLEAFRSLPGRKLVVAGDGPGLARCRKLAPPNVELLGSVGQDRLRGMMLEAKAFLYAGEEDFGIVLAEAQACGTPVVCYGRGGAADIVKDGDTGLMFAEQTADAVGDAVWRFQRMGNCWDPARIRRRALRFDKRVFRQALMDEFSSLVEPGVADSGKARPQEAVER